MYRNVYRNQSQTQSQTQTQTQTQPNTFTGNYNTLGGSQTQSQTQSQTSSNDEIIFAIVTGNLASVRKLVNSSNVNNIIDKKNNYTPLHHAVRIKKNDSIIEYLMTCGANPNIKQDEGKDSIDLAIESNYRYLIDKLMGAKELELDILYTKYDNLNYQVKGLERSNQELTKTNEYLTKSTSQYVEKIEELKVENSNLKRKYEESEKAFSNLLKKTKKN